ncbi:MAG TPA: phosphoglycerate mutase family protein [Thermoanaerobaculia bacterium]|nr:phosphoglycerate mutase family protein [Thermoanaerobaculia bacterium]
MTERTIILFRHGIAEDKDTKPDEERALTAAGRSRMKEIAAGLAACERRPDAIFTSPLVRCVETADRLSRAWKRGVSIFETDALRPQSGIKEFRGLLDQSQELERILCVGHEPNLTALMRALTGARGKGATELKKGGCYGLFLPEEGPAALEWMLPPRVLRRVR